MSLFFIFLSPAQQSREGHNCTLRRTLIASFRGKRKNNTTFLLFGIVIIIISSSSITLAQQLPRKMEGSIFMLFIMWNLYSLCYFKCLSFQLRIDWIESFPYRENPPPHCWCGQQQQQQQQHGRQLRTSQARSPMNINREGIRFLFFSPRAYILLNVRWITTNFSISLF